MKKSIRRGEETKSFYSRSKSTTLWQTRFDLSVIIRKKALNKKSLMKFGPATKKDFSRIINKRDVTKIPSFFGEFLLKCFQQLWFIQK